MLDDVIELVMLVLVYCFVLVWLGLDLLEEWWMVMGVLKWILGMLLLLL